MDKEKSPAPPPSGGLPPPSGRYSAFSPNGSSFAMKAESSFPPLTPSGSNSSDANRFSHDISRMPDNPPKNLGHRRAHSEILTLPDDLSFDSDLGVVGAADGPSFSDDTDEDLLYMYLDMEKFNSSATSTSQMGEPSEPTWRNELASTSNLQSTPGSSSERPRIRHQHSQSMDGSTTIKPEMLMSGNEDVSGVDSKKAISAAKLSELALIDPKRAKRIWANRQSAARSKERKMRYIAELERKVQTLQTEATSLSAQLTLLQRDTNGLGVENNELKLRVQTMEQQVHLQDALNDALKEEVQHLKVLTGQGPSNGTSMNYGSFGSNQQFYPNNQSMHTILAAQQLREQRVGPFHKSFSAVVGPNGSGKSNVIDAMLFVFGKRAKQMRLNKVSELIHNSTNHQNLDSAGVSVQFEEIIDLENGLYETVPGSDFMITRVAFRDNSSKYYINERSSNFTEVTKKLKGKGVDLDNNRFLILQGEVEQISLMKPKAQGPHDEGFLEYLEDIIGTNKYVEKIDELNKQLETLNESRSGVVQMVKLAEKERDNLEGLKDEAETYMLKELSHLKWQEKATKMAYEDTVAKITEQRDSLQNLENSLKDERVKMDESNEELKKFESVHEKHKKRQEVLDNELRACKEKFKEFERQDVKHREDLKHVKQKIKKLEDKLEKDSSKIGDMTKESEDSSNLIPKLQENIPKLQKVLLDEEKKLEEIKAIAKVETEGYRSELTKIRAELEPWEKDLIVHRGKLDVASSESELLSKKHEAALKAFTDAQKQLSDISTRKKEKAAATTSWKADIKKKKQEAIEARKVEEESLKEQETLVPQEQAAREKVAELKSAMNSEKSQNEVLKAVLRAKENNQIEGIYGRMGDLGAIDAKYDVAISTACAGLDYIVVETTSSAQACVELLRKGNLGFATFMILEKQTDHIHKLKEKVKTPEDVPRLFDLVRVKDERMKLAFYAALGNTVVAKDLDQATRIAYGGNREFRRVVALDGALFEKSGTMSGGGGKARGGRMGTSIRATGVSGEAVANAENELSKIVDMLNNIREKVGNAVRQYRAAENEVSGLEMELAKSQREIESLNSEHNYLEKQLASLEAASQPKTDEIDRLKELKKIISKEEKEIENLEKGSKQLKDKALELQTNIENAGGEKLKGQKAKVEKIQTDIDKNNTEINRCNVQIETNQKLIKKLTKGIEEATREKERLEGEKENLHVTFKDITQKAFEIQETYKKTQQLIDEHKDVLTGAKSDYENLKKSVDELKASRVDAEFKVQDMKKKYNELEMREKGYKKKLNDLQIAFTKHMEQIQKDLVDPDKLQATLMDNNLNEACDLKRALEMVALLEAQLKELNPNLDSIAEYRSKVELYNGRVDELNSVTQERDDTRKQYDELRKRRLDEFMAGFNTISLKLKEMYQMITLGGDAELELVDSLDPFSEGVVFSVRPPKKSWKNIANLSGGEKTLSSLALVFALHHYKPTPLYVMDEIDAALDFKNVSIVGHYVKDRTKDAQFIIISLRNNMFELADRLVGIYKTDNCTKSITINPGSFAVCQKTPA